MGIKNLFIYDMFTLACLLKFRESPTKKQAIDSQWNLESTIIICPCLRGHDMGISSCLFHT